MSHRRLASAVVALAFAALAVSCSHDDGTKQPVASNAAPSRCYLGKVTEQPIPIATSEIRPPVVDATKFRTATPIKHVIFIMKENRTFDNLFGAFPGANGASTGKLGDKTVSLTSHCFPQALPKDIVHDYPVALANWNHGKMNGFDTTPFQAEWAYTQAKQSDIPNYWQWAEDFSLSDNFFTSVLGPSYPNHLYSIAGTAAGTHDNPIPPTGNIQDLYAQFGVQKSWGCDSPKSTRILVDHSGRANPPAKWFERTADREYPCFDISVLPDSLKDAGIPWAYYGADKTQTGYFWDSPGYIRHIRNNPLIWESHVHGVNEIVPDIRDGRLPPVTWVTPSFWLSDHPDANLCNGENWTTTVVNAVMKSPMWKDTAIFLVWDDWGGLYDHVPPPDDLGFRSPVITISPYAKRGYIDHTQGNFGSILNFVESNWQLRDPLRLDRPTTGDMSQNFDFTQTPLSPDPLSLRHDCQQFQDKRAYVAGETQT